MHSNTNNLPGIKLDGAIVTHPHADHLDGVERLFRELLPLQYQESVMSARPEKRLMCNGPVLLTRKFAQKDEAYRSFSDFLLTAKFEIGLDKDDILNAFGNDIVFTFPSSPGVLYQRQKPSEDDEPFSEEKQRSKLKGGTEDDDLNKSSIIMYTQKGGKICLSGDAYGYDIVAMLRKQGVKDLDIFKLPHHGSAKNSILGKVLPPPWAFQNLASMLLLSISLKKKITFERNPEEESGIDYLRQELKAIAGDGHGEEVQRIAEAFLRELQARLEKGPQQITPDELLNNIKEKHIGIVEAIQQQSGGIDPCENLRPLKSLEDWNTLRNNVANTLVFHRSPGSTKAQKVDMSPLVGTLMGEDPIYQHYFAGKIGIDAFFQSFHSKTYYVSAEGKYGHPSAEVIKGIIKAAVKKNKPCRIVFTSGGAMPSKYLPDAQHKHYKEWNKLVSLYYLKSNVSFKLDPSNDANVAPSGTAKFESEDKVRIDVAAQLKKNFGFTIPQRSFLPTLDKYYVKTKMSDNKFLWLKVDSDGKFFLTSTKSNQNVLMVSNAPSINGDLRMLTLKSHSENGGERNIWLEKAKGKGFLLKGSAEGDYLFEENGSLKCGNKNEGSFFFFEHKTFSGQMNSGKEVSIVQFLKSFGYNGDDQSINVRRVLEILLGIPNMKRLIEELPSDFIGIATLDHRVNLSSSTVELSSSVDCEVVSSHIEVMLSTTSVTFDMHKVTKLEVVVRDPCATNPNLLLFISTTLHNTRYTVDLSKHLKPREPSVDMYLNVLGGVPLEGRSNMTLGTLLERVMGLLPLETMSNCLQTQLLAREMFTWKVDRVLSTVNYFISPLTVEVLSGDMYVNIPPGMNSITFADTVSVHLSRIHVMVSDPRTEKSNFVTECDAEIGSISVNMKMVPTSTSVPELTIAFPESVNVVAVLKTLGVPGNLLDLSVPLANEVIKNLELTKPRISVVQDVPSSKVTRISCVSFDFSFDMFPSVLPSSLPLPQDSRASLSIFNPFSGQLQVGVDVEFNLPVSSSVNNSFLISKFSLWPVELSDLETQTSYRFSISLWPSSSGISIQSVLQAAGLGELTESMTSSFPCISSVLTNVQLDKVTLEANTQSRTIDSLTLSLTVPEFSIIEGMLSMHEANLLVQHGGDQWYAETEMKLLVFNKFVCQAAFSFPKPDVPGSLTFQNTETLFTLKEFVAGIGVAVPNDVPVIKGVLDVKISEVSISCENDGASFKLNKAVTVLEKRTLTVGAIKLYNLELEVCYANITEHSSVSFSLQGYLNPKTHASLAYDAEQRELLGRYVLTENTSSSDCLNELFHDEMDDFSSSTAFDQVKSLHVQEVKVALSFPREKDWSLKEFVLSMEGTLSLGPFNLKQLRLHYVKDQADDAKHVAVVGHFKSDDQLLSFTMELSCRGQQSKSTALEAAIRPDYPGGVTLSSLLQLIGLKSPEVPQVDGSPDFLNIELKVTVRKYLQQNNLCVRQLNKLVSHTKIFRMSSTNNAMPKRETEVYKPYIYISFSHNSKFNKRVYYFQNPMTMSNLLSFQEAFLRFEVSPFRIRKADVVIQTTETLTILENPLIQLHEARLEYHLDDTNDSAQTQIFIAGGFILAALRFDITLRKNDENRGLILEGRLQGEKNADNLDFEQAAKQLSPDVPFSLPKNVALSWFLFRLDRNEETTSLKLEGESHINWSIDAGFTTITVENLGGKLKFEKHRTSDAWTGFVCLTGKVLLLETVAAAVDVYHDSKGDTLVLGTVCEPEKIDLQVMTRKFAPSSDSSKSWNRLIPEETESSVRSPRFNSASLFINFSRKSLLFYGDVVGFGTGLLMVKKTDGNEKSSEYGFLFGLSLGRDFKFALLNRSLGVVDEILSVQQANLSVISMDHVTVEEICKDFSKLKGIGHKQQEVDVPFTDLDIQAISKLQVRLGVTAFAKVTFSGGESKLLSNVTQIQRGEELADIVLFAHIAVKGMDTVFMAQMKEMKLFGGSLRFQEITLTYQPSEGNTFTLSGKMSLTLTDDSNPIVFHGRLRISESKADFSMTVGGNPGNIHEPFGMFGITFEDPQLQLSWIFDQEEHLPSVPFCAISGTVNFSKSASSSENQPVTTLKGSILFQEGKPVVASVSLDLNHPLSIDDMFATLFKEHWPSGYLDISFKEGEIYYAKAEIEVDGKIYKEGFHGQTEIQIFGNAFGVEVSVDRRGMTVKGYTKFEIDLVIATLTGKHFEEDKGPEIEIARYDGKTKFELSTGVTLLQEKIGTCSVGYDVQQKCFLGGVTYDGELLGVSHPSVDFEWSQETEFKIRKWPVILDLQELIDFAKAFEELSQMIDSPCEKLVGLVFDKVIKTKCRLDVKQVSVKDSGNPDAWFALRLEGKLDIMIVTDKPSVTVNLPEMVVAITKPSKQFRLSNLPGFLISEIAKNSLELARQVFTQPKQLTEFMAALGSIKLSRKVLSGLICRGAHSPNVTNQATTELESMEGEASSSEGALETAFEELIA